MAGTKFAKDSAEKFATNEVVERQQDEAIRRSAARVTAINETTRAGIRERVREAIDQGMSAREAGEYVRGWSGFSPYRSEMIARTETAWAYNQSALGTYGEYGVSHVIADDGDKDEECARRHGGTFTVNEAAEIFDHPNGTLDWVPVAPGYSPERVRSELDAIRPIHDRPGDTFVERGPTTVPEVKPVAPTPRDEYISWLKNADAEDVRFAVHQRQQIHGHTVTLDDVAEHRWGWKGDAQGRRVIREENMVADFDNPGQLKPYYQWRIGHESEFVRAYERVRAATGDKLNIDQVAFRRTTHPKAAADYRARGTHWKYDEKHLGDDTYAGGLTDVSQVNVYPNSSRYLNQRGNYSEYMGEDDLLSVYTHELGHAYDFGRGSLSKWEEIHANSGIAADPKRLESEIRKIRKQIKDAQASRQTALHVIEQDRLTGTHTTPFWHQRVVDMDMLLTRLNMSEAMLVQMRKEAKAAEAFLTQYAGKNRYEDFAESFWFYVFQPETMKRRAPGRFAFMDDLIKAVKRGERP